MNIKELKEFLKDIPDDVKIICMKEKENLGAYYACHEEMTEQDIYFNANSNEVIIGS